LRRCSIRPWALYDARLSGFRLFRADAWRPHLASRHPALSPDMQFGCDDPESFTMPGEYGAAP